MNTIPKKMTFTLALAATALLATVTVADPLPNRDRLKFSQLPMVATPVLDINGTVTTYGGHDELSTAYGFPNTANIIPSYDGRFMADDFADKLSTPVLHVKWWGSYAHDIINPNMPVNKFLISFESDIPQSAANTFSKPGQPLLNQVVTRNPLTVGSGTFTEKKIRGPDAVVGESLYEYNAELHLNAPFPEQANTVYWLKIAAMVDVPQGLTFDPYNPQNSLVPVTQWGWHNRDYTIQNPLASTSLSTGPGEYLDGVINGTNVYHFQDDAVMGDVRINVLPPASLQNPNVFQPPQNMQPTFYLDGADGPASPIPGAIGISHFSKDLAFQLFTTVPEPATCMLFLFGGLGLAGMTQRRTRR